MGISGLFEFLKKQDPSIFDEIHIAEYARRRIAIDVSGLMYRFKYSGPTWMNSMVHLLSIFKRHTIHAIFVFDGKPPIEKYKTQLLRKESRENQERLIETLESALASYEADPSFIDPILIAEMKDFPVPPLRKIAGTAVKLSTFVDTKWIRSKIKARQRTIIRITEADVKNIQELLTAAGYSYIQAEGEAEALCAGLCLANKADAVLSEDSDTLVYGNVELLIRFDPYRGGCTRVITGHVLHVLSAKLAKDVDFCTFRDLCILFGTDYNNNIPGIGPAGAWKLIGEHDDIENLPTHYGKKPIDKSILNHVRVRELFTPPNVEAIKIKPARPANPLLVQNWMAVHSRMNASVLLAPK